MVRFVKEYEARGDPGELGDRAKRAGCGTDLGFLSIYSAAQEGVFAGKYLRPGLRSCRDFSHVRIFVWDHNKECAYERACGSMAQEGAKDIYVAGVLAYPLVYRAIILKIWI